MRHESPRASLVRKDLDPAAQHRGGEFLGTEPEVPEGDENQADLGLAQKLDSGDLS
jgi:hypothetical protein